MATTADAEDKDAELGLTIVDDVEVIDEDGDAEEGEVKDAPKPGNGKKPVKPAKESNKKKAPESAHDDPSRHEYWQSKHDQLQEKLKGYEALAPLGRLIAENPEVLDVIEKTVKAKQTPSEPEIKKPERPVKPSDFDEVAAVSDPESKSFKYRKEFEAYTEQLVDYTEKREELREKREVERANRERELAKRNTAESTLRVQLRAKGFDEDGIEDFIKVMGSPESISLENLTKLYRIQKGLQPDPEKPKRKPTDAPLPLGVDGGGESDDDSEPTEEENFNLSLVDAARKAIKPKRFTPLATSNIFRK